MIATLAQRVRTLEASHQRIHNSFKPKGLYICTPLIFNVLRQNSK